MNFLEVGIGLYLAAAYIAAPRRRNSTLSKRAFFVRLRKTGLPQWLPQ